jgi:hypothetical protein
MLVERMLLAELWMLV